MAPKLLTRSSSKTISSGRSGTGEAEGSGSGNPAPEQQRDERDASGRGPEGEEDAEEEEQEQDDTDPNDTPPEPKTLQEKLAEAQEALMRKGDGLEDHPGDAEYARDLERLKERVKTYREILELQGPVIIAPAVNRKRAATDTPLEKEDSSSERFRKFANSHKTPKIPKPLSNAKWTKWSTEIERNFGIFTIVTNPLPEPLFLWLLDAVEYYPEHQTTLQNLRKEGKVESWEQFSDVLHGLIVPKAQNELTAYSKYRDLKQLDGQSIDEFNSYLSTTANIVPESLRDDANNSLQWRLWTFHSRLNEQTIKALKTYRPEWVNYTTETRLVEEVRSLEQASQIVLKSSKSKEKNDSKESTDAKKGRERSRIRGGKGRGDNKSPAPPGKTAEAPAGAPNRVSFSDTKERTEQTKPPSGPGGNSKWNRNSHGGKNSEKGRS